MSLDVKKLQDLLLAYNLVPASQVQNCLKEAAEDSKSLEEKLIEHNYLTADQLGDLIEKAFGLKYIRLATIVIPDAVLQEIPFPMAGNQSMIAFEEDEKTIKIASSNPENTEGVKFMQQKTGLNVQLYYTTPEEIKHKLKSYHRDLHERFDKLIKNILANPKELDSLKNSSHLLDTVIILAYQSRASDIHIEPHRKNLLIRYRIDGILQDIIALPKELQDLITSRIKVLANLRTDEHRTPQDGRFKTDIDNEELTLRVSVVPIYDGEKIVLRLLASENKVMTLENLGYNSKNLATIRDGSHKNHGMILVTGPTGSGKTTTLYAVLRELNTREVNICTIEDPIEYRLEGVNQIQVNNETGVTFAAGLRSLLRQDPNIIMVGEIRDNETAEIGVNAALTGHLVLATLHTNNSSSTLIRLIEMGIEPFLVGSTVILAIAQRLVRNICDGCKASYELDKGELAKLAENMKLNMSSVEQLHKILSKKSGQNEKIMFYRGSGCHQCSNTGYQGRSCIVEVLNVDENIRLLITKNESPDMIEKKAAELGMTTMFEDGIEKALAGETTLEEVLRVIRE